MVDKTKNPVAKHARTFNKAHVMTDRKKREKAGYSKHKGAANENVDAATKERDKARMTLKHAKQRHTLSVNQEKEKERVANESIEEAKAPSTVKHKGKTYYSTGKRGKHAKTGAWSSEYSSDMDGGDERVWYNTKTKKITRESFEQVDESQVLSNKKKELSAKMFGDVKYLNPAQRKELDTAAKAAVKADRAAKKAAPAQKTATKTSKGKTHTGSGDPADRNLIMQLRKAQDVDGKMDIQVTPTGKTVRLPKKQIDALLKKHDSLGKPVDKRKFKIMLTKALRAKAK